MAPAVPGPPSRAAAFRYWLRLGCISFGGPAGQIGTLHREVVVLRQWLGEDEFARALSFCMLLPGPEALQLVIYLGWRWHGAPGGIVAGLCFLVPAALLLTGLSFVYVVYGTLAPVAALVTGLKGVVVAVVVRALWGLGRRSLTTSWQRLLALAAFVALVVARLPFPLLVAGGALTGALSLRAPPSPGAAAPPPPRRRMLALLVAGAALWLAPWPLLATAATGALPARLYLFFTKVALAGFGGAYALLAYVNQELVTTLGWLSPRDMVAGLALAETTPGPLVLVLQFDGFVSGWHAPGPLAPAAAALLCGALASWATFLPSFVLVMAFAPYVERLTANARLAAALKGVTAVVVGVIGSFALAVALAVLLPHGLGAPDWRAVAIAIAAGAAFAGTRLGLGWVLAGGAALSLAASWLGA